MNVTLIYPFHVISKLQAAKHHSCCLAHGSSNAAIKKWMSLLESVTMICRNFFQSDV